MDVQMIPFGSAELPALLEGILQVYLDAFQGPPYNQDHGGMLAFEAVIQRHVQREGFCGFWAAGPAAEVLGFGYGYTGGPGQWWYEIVTAGMQPALVSEWFSDYFEFVELAVAPQHQGRGIGGRLHDALLACTARPLALLTTADSDTPALRLYKNRGWRTLRECLIFPGDTLPRLVMGKRLRPALP